MISVVYNYDRWFSVHLFSLSMTTQYAVLDQLQNYYSGGLKLYYTPCTCLYLPISAIYLAQLFTQHLLSCWYTNLLERSANSFDICAALLLSAFLFSKFNTFEISQVRLLAQPQALKKCRYCFSIVLPIRVSENYSKDVFYMICYISELNGNTTGSSSSSCGGL